MNYQISKDAPDSTSLTVVLFTEDMSAAEVIAREIRVTTGATVAEPKVGIDYRDATFEEESVVYIEVTNTTAAIAEAAIHGVMSKRHGKLI